MATSEVAICNMALMNVGMKATINSLDEETAQAQVCKVFYAHCRDVTLASWPWPFATKQATLAELDVERTNWAYIYQLPVDCLTPRYLVAEGRTPLASARIPYELMASDALSTTVLATDLPEAELSYTAKLTNPNMFPPEFVDALTYMLATKFILPLAVQPSPLVQLVQLYEQTMRRAKASALNAQQLDYGPDSELIAVRG